MSERWTDVRVAVVQAAPVIMEREATIEKVARLTREAAANGARLVLFPEAFVPAYPRGLSFGVVVGGRTDAGRRTWARYNANAVEIPSVATDALGRAARESGVFLAIGVIERDRVSGGTLYCTLLYFGPDGRLLGKHRKLKPTAGERLIWGEGDGSTLPVFDTAIGKVGGLICWENYMPLARMAMYRKGVEIYLAPTADARDTWQATLQHIALEGRCFVLGCNQYVTKAMYPADLEGLEDLADAPEELCRGGSAIISPLGQTLAGPLYGAEGILYADLASGTIAEGKFDFDVIGHYARNDIFSFAVNEAPQTSAIDVRDAEPVTDAQEGTAPHWQSNRWAVMSTAHSTTREATIMMNAGGLSKARLGRMHDVMAGYVERGDVSGLVTLVSRRGETHIDTIGMQAVGGSDPMRRDTIFRISSMTKPITAVAAMILVEECKLRLDESVDRLLPELANRTVLKRLDGPLDDTVPAHRPITVRDLLTFRMGFGQMMAPPDAYPILRAASEQQIGMGPPSPATMPAPDEWMRRLGALPLMGQPGERWMYNTGSDVLGVLIARAAGQPLETFMRERLFAPLGMKDTGFSVPAAKIDRFATSYGVDPEAGALNVFDEAAGGQWSRPPAFPSGAAGLVSTVDDYLAFCEMMLNKGKYGSERILSRLSVKTMTTDQLTPTQRAATGIFLGDNRGWGFGMSIITKRDDLSAVPGRFGWDGGLGTSGYSDPSEEMVAILMTQRAVFPSFSGVYLDFWTAAYQAIDD